MRLNIFICLTDHCPIGPITMIIDESLNRSNQIFLNATFFMTFSRSSIEDLFMGITRTTRNSPGVAIVNPWGSVLKQDCTITHKEEASCAVEAPVSIAT